MAFFLSLKNVGTKNVYTFCIAVLYVRTIGTQIILAAAADDVALGGTPWGGTKGCVARNRSRKITWGFRVFSLLDTIETTHGDKMG